MAKIAPTGRPSQEEVDLAEKLVSQMEEMVSRRKEMPPILAKILGLNQQIALTGDEVLTKSGKKLKYDKETAKALIQVNDINADIMDSLSDQFDGLGGIIQKIRGIGAALKILMLNPATALLAIFGTLIALGIQFAKRVNEIRADTGVAADEAKKLAVQMKKAEISAKRFMIDSDKMKEATDALVNQYGQLNKEIVDLSVPFARLVRNGGLQADQAAEMISLLQTQEGVTKRIAMNQLEGLIHTARLEGVTPSAVFSHLAENGELFASSIGKSEKNLIKAVAAAKKLGMEFKDLTEFADGLLDITERVNKEQHLSLIFQRAISLERVAALHAAGRIEEAQRALASQLRGFGQLSELKQRQVARQTDFTVQEIRKLVTLAQEGNEITKKGWRDSRFSNLD